MDINGEKLAFKKNCIQSVHHKTLYPLFNLLWKDGEEKKLIIA